MEQIHHLPRAPQAAHAAVSTSRSLTLPLALPSPSGASGGVPSGPLPHTPSRVAWSVVVVVAAHCRCHRRRQNRCSGLSLKPQLSLPPIKIARRRCRRRSKMKITRWPGEAERMAPKQTKMEIQNGCVGYLRTYVICSMFWGQRNVCMGAMPPTPPI